MTTEFATAYLRRYQLWRSGKDERTMEDAGLTPAEITQALQTVIEAVPVLLSSLNSTRAQLAKCQIQRERFHSQLRRRSTPPA